MVQYGSAWNEGSGKEMQEEGIDRKDLGNAEAIKFMRKKWKYSGELENV